MKNAVMSKKRVGVTSWIFLTTKSKTYFANISTATVSPKCKTIGITKQTPKPSRIIAEMNANVEHTFTVLNSTKIFILLVLFKNRAKLH